MIGPSEEGGELGCVGLNLRIGGGLEGIDGGRF